jgi:Skp family chaperone for outer membrane proteins
MKRPVSQNTSEPKTDRERNETARYRAAGASGEIKSNFRRSEQDAVKSAIPVDQKAFAAKQDEGQRLQREGEFKKKELDAAVDKRNQDLLGPVTSDILKAVQDFAKQKGYVAVLDISMLDQAHAILALDPSADITKEFIVFYNARPNSTATTATPR